MRPGTTAPRRPDEPLKAFTTLALEHAFVRLARVGKIVPFCQWYTEGEQFAALFDDVEGALDGARAHVRTLGPLVERYAVIYDAIDREGRLALVAECGDRRGGFEFAVRYAAADGQIRPQPPFLVNPLPGTLLATLA